MTELKAFRGLMRGLKVILFFIILLVLAIVSLVLMFRSGQTKLSGSALANGTAFVSQSQTNDWLQRDLLTDQQAEPVLTLSGDNTIPVEIGGSYTEPGYTAKDSAGKDLTDRVEAVIDGNFLKYTVSDEQGNQTTATRSITYVDTMPPEITLTDGDEIHLEPGEEYVDPGYTAIDNADGDVTANVQVSGSVEKYKLGSYPITYTVSDSNGNTQTVTRTVYRDAAEQPEQVNPGDKVIYLTFDDGPGEYTEKLLDILDQYDVKVTFFVTAQFENYLDMIGEEYRRGHTVAIHSYSHDFSIYTSEDTYFEDLNAMQDVIREQTGTETTIVRFPGGSSNTVSTSYCSGIMTTLAADLEAMGYQYFDWNVTSGDAGETTNTDTVIHNVTTEVANNGDTPSVVLQHDIKGFSVDAVEDIIVWGLDNGYKFLPLDSTSPVVHHGINN